jgi:tRNA nucleotidyltransferase (CCA-adding enzyme)
VWNELSAVMKKSFTDERGPADVDLRRWAALAGRTRLASVLRLADAVWWAERNAGLPAPSKERVASVYRRAIRVAYRDPVEVADLAIGGTDLERLGLKGPAVGLTLRKLLERVISDPAVNTRERLLALARDDAAGLEGEPVERY